MTFIEKFAIALTALMTLGFVGYVMLENQPSQEFVITTEYNRTETVQETPVEEEEEIIVISAESPLNINSATQVELEQLPNIGEKRALDIIAFREEHGGFASIEDIMLVSGIGEGIFQDLQDIIWVEIPQEIEEAPPEEEELVIEEDVLIEVEAAA